MSINKAWGFLLVAGLAGCGGGSDGDDTPSAPTTPAADAAGFYASNSSSGQDQLMMVFDDGTFYVLSTGDDFGDSTMIIGTGQARNGSFTSTDARRFSTGAAAPATVSASYLNKRSFNGNATVASPAQTLSFAGTYDAAYERRAQLSTVAGTYSGITASSLFLEDADITVTATGAFTGRGDSGCTLSGTVTPKASGNAFDLRYTFGASPCAAANQTFTGVALADAGELLAITTSTDRQTAVIFAGASR